MKLTIATILILAAPYLAYGEDDPHAACAAPPIHVPVALLEKPLPIRQGIGNSHQVVSTQSPEAQAYYDQGLNYLESYVWIEASRSFHQALRLDPNLAMAWLGLSRVRTGFDDPTGARAYLAKAQALAERANPRERRLFDVRAKQLDAIDDLENAAKFAAYKKAIDDALVAEVDDPQLWLWRGNAEESNASGRGQRGTAGSVAFYEKVLQLVPDHASAHHYLIHTFETIGRIDRALAHGEAYARLSPAIPHAAHMWGHDLRRVGKIDQAIDQFLKANVLELEYYKSEKVNPALDWHHGHNLDLLATCYEHKGQMKLAEKTMRASAKLGAIDAYRAFNQRELPNFLIHRERYAEALQAARVLVAYKFPQARAVGHALAGQAMIGLGRDAESLKELEEARRELEDVPRVTPGLIPRRGAIEPWVNALQGEILLRAGRLEEGRKVLEDVARALRASPGPDAWTQNLFRLESLARSARKAGDWELASFLADQMLEHDASYGGSHLARALVLRHRGDIEGARQATESAKGFWSEADRDLAERKAWAVLER